MGPAHSTIKNKTMKKICVISFDQADILCTKYNTMYIIDPGCELIVQALPDAYGLRVGIIYDASPDGNILMYSLYSCKNDSILIIEQMIGADIVTTGDNTKNLKKGEIKVRNDEAFGTAVAALTYIPPISKANIRR